jgi:Rrf2 family transcriptional regulator, iron-sulfur cluster assembly transcription factor
MFSKSCEYAIRAIVYVASKSNVDGKLGIQDICAHIEAPLHFTAKILQVLSRSNIISSQKGVHGGFFLNDKQRRLPLYKVVEAIDGNKIFTGCGLGLKQCSETKPCPIHHQFKEVRDKLNIMMKETTIEMLASRLNKGDSVLIQ